MKSEEAKEVYRVWNLMDEAKDLRQIDKDSYTDSKWMVFILSVAAFYEFLYGYASMAIFCFAIGAFHIYNLFKRRADIKEYNNTIRRYRTDLNHLYVHGMKTKDEPSPTWERDRCC